MNLITRYIVFDPARNRYLTPRGDWTTPVGLAQHFVSEMDARDALSMKLHKDAKNSNRISGAFEITKIWAPQIANQKTD